MDNNFHNVEQRVQRYWYTDGIGEIMGGGMSLLLGLYFSVQEYFGDQSPVGMILQMSFVLILIGSIFVVRRLVNLLKARVTYPRTGYVEYRIDNKKIRSRRIFTAAIAMIVAMVSVFIARKIDFIDSMVAVTGVLVAVVLVVKQGWSSGVGRFYVLSAVSLFLGIALSFSGLASGYSLGVFYGLMGLAFVISGGLTLRRYLHENPMPAEDSNER